MNREITRLCRDYRFRYFPETQADPAVFTPEFDDSGWETVRVPHDWAVHGTFCRENDYSRDPVDPDGLYEPLEHTGRTGALPTVGLGVYRKWLQIPESDRGRRIFLEFDGIMWNSEIYINGKKVFFNHFGYKSFCVDITEWVNYGQPTLLAVGATVQPDCSRWYPGAGIFRNVRLVKKNKVHMTYNGIWLRQLEIGAGTASFELCVSHTGDDSVSFEAAILDPDGSLVTTVKHGCMFGELCEVFILPQVRLWDLETPELYTARVRLLDGSGTVTDETEVRFGARAIRFTPDKGFFLNGRQQKLYGVCDHHDLGSLGAAVSVPALRRKLELLRSMGVNSIRTSHNPPAPELLDLCDEMGFVVMDEFFDEWYTPKIANGYAQHFHAHAVQDAIEVIQRDRNHPSIILWSIGNEIYEQASPEGWRPAKLLADTVRRTDPTRPVTAGLNMGEEGLKNHLVDYLDVAGFNYKPEMYRIFHEKHPNWCLLGTETASCVSTRGVYHLPAEISIPVVKHDDLTVSAYEMEAPGWACFAERELSAQRDCEFVAGEYLWTGIDYLGEPTPYYGEWPSRSSYFGAIDLAGLPKNRYWLYRSCWTDEPVLHVFPHWNWEGMEGQCVPVHAFTNFPEAELFINGKSFGRRKLRTEADGTDMGDVLRFRMIWENAVYEPGEVKVVAYDAAGEAVRETRVRTAGKPARIALSTLRNTIDADGEDLLYVTASITDEQGVVCPHADHRLFFRVTGAGELLTTDAGDQRETETFYRPDKKALAGLCVGCIRSLETPGALTVTVTAEGLEPACAHFRAV